MFLKVNRFCSQIEETWSTAFEEVQVNSKKFLKSGFLGGSSKLVLIEGWQLMCLT